MGIEFDKLSDPAQLVGKPEYNADTASLIDLTTAATSLLLLPDL